MSGSIYTWQFTTADITSPVILEVLPVVSAAEVDLNTPIMITFSESIDPLTFSYIVSPDPAGWTITWSENYEVVTLGHNDFQQSTVYYASVSSADDLAGNPLKDSPYSWEFTTKNTWIPVLIDIKPGDTINSINNDGNGIIPVAIYGSATFNVMLIDPTSVYLDSQAVRAVGRSGKLQASFDDINDDGYLDMIVQIEDIDGTYQEGDTIATLTGLTYTGQFFRGSDAIRIVP